MVAKAETFKAALRRRYLIAFDEIKAKHNLDDKSLATALKMPQSWISQMRSGKRGPTLEQLVALCDKYNYDLVYLIKGDSKKGSKRPADGVTLEQIYREMQEIKEAITPATKRQK